MKISGEENKFIASQDLEVYYLNHISGFDVDFYSIPKGEIEYTVTKYFSELNTFITPKNPLTPEKFTGEYKETIEDNTTIVSRVGRKNYNKAIIPKGTTYYISDDLNYIIPELLYITSEKLMKHKDTDISDLYKYGVDVYTKNGERHKVTSEEYNIEDVIGVFVDDNIVMSLFLYKVNYGNRKITEDAIRSTYPLDDNKGYENTQILKKYNKNLEKLCKDDLYIPSIGELIEVYKNLFKINLTLEYLGIEIISYGESFLSSTFRTYDTCWRFIIRKDDIYIDEVDFYLYHETNLFIKI